MPLETRKGVFYYEYITDFSKLQKTCLPPKERFYSSLTDSHISDADYEHAKTVWEKFGCRTLGEYCDLYLRCNVLLLCDVFQNFRSVCLREYSLDPAHYVSAPGLSFDAMFLKTGVDLELLTDIDMILFTESSIRGGLTTCVKKHAVANNPYVPDSFNEHLPRNYIIYSDSNNLYGAAMSRPLPYSKFQWVDENQTENILSNILSHPDDDSTGFMFEVDIEYPAYLHDAHNDLPFLPLNEKPPGLKCKKLLASLNSKKKYIVHYTFC